MKKIYSIIFLLMLVTSVVNAATRTASVNGNWNSIITWGGASVPGAADDVIINSGITVTVNVAAVCNSLTTTGGTLNVSSANLTITDGGSITIGTGGSIIFSAANVINGGGSGSNGILVTINAGAILTTANAAGFVTGNGNNLIGGSFAIKVGSRGGPGYSTSADYNFNGAAQSTGTGITGAANLTFAGSGNKTITNAGTTVTGALSMQGTAVLITTAPAYSGAASMLEYNGSGAQTSTSIEFPSASGPANLKINNASGVTLHAARTISGSLILTNGILNTTGTNLLTITGTGAGGGGSDVSHVNGPMAKTGSTNFSFPVGNSTLYRPVDISSLSGSLTFTASYVQANPQTTFGNTMGTGINHISACEYWILDRTEVSGTATVRLNFGTPSCNANPYVNDPSSLRVARFTGASGSPANTWEDAGNTSSSSTQVTSSPVSTFSPFTVGSSGVLNPLPVKLSNIRAFEKLQGVQINWTAYQEENLSRYSVERSANGITFTSIGEVASLNSAVEKNYGFFDASPLAGINFYRLRIIDIDSRFAYSSIVKVNLDKSVKDISLYPNPATGGYISFQGADLVKGNYTVKVYNSAGIQVMGQNFTHTGGAINQTLKLPTGTKSGMYSLQLINGDVKVMSKTFMVQ